MSTIDVVCIFSLVHLGCCCVLAAIDAASLSNRGCRWCFSRRGMRSSARSNSREAKSPLHPNVVPYVPKHPHMLKLYSRQRTRMHAHYVGRDPSRVFTFRQTSARPRAYSRVLLKHPTQNTPCQGSKQPKHARRVSEKKSVASDRDPLVVLRHTSWMMIVSRVSGNFGGWRGMSTTRLGAHPLYSSVINALRRRHVKRRRISTRRSYTRRVESLRCERESRQ